ncbi:cupin domain-containing protein [Glycomyces terrestris]|uniref:cupin domain-containing protein n=1 Tax=Glycomyces terrestris TaxID=2493553 RepID=UPI0018D59501|nr:cupin domain-containing protein [Glycomyces terrestris]
MRITRSGDARRTATPAAVMTTLASPTLGGAPFPLWRVEAEPGTAGPLHLIDADQVWTLTAGTVEVECGGEAAVLEAGDTVVVPAGAHRRFTPGPGGFTAVVAGPAGMRASMPASPEEKIDLAWAA